MIFPFSTGEERQQLRDVCALVDSMDARDQLEFARAAATTFPQVLEALARSEGRDGGQIGRHVVQAVEDHFLARFDGRVLLAMGVDVTQLTVSVARTGDATAVLALRFRPC